MNWSIHAELACLKNPIFINIKIKIFETAGLQNTKKSKIDRFKAKKKTLFEEYQKI